MIGSRPTGYSATMTIQERDLTTEWTRPGQPLVTMESDPDSTDGGDADGTDGGDSDGTDGGDSDGSDA